MDDRTRGTVFLTPALGSAEWHRQEFIIRYGMTPEEYKATTPKFKKMMAGLAQRRADHAVVMAIADALALAEATKAEKIRVATHEAERCGQYRAPELVNGRMVPGGWRWELYYDAV